MLNWLKDNTIRKFYILKMIWNRDENFLVNTGWVRSFKERRPVDHKGMAVPWFSLACIYFLHDRIRSSMDVFEFGSGNSSLYFAGRASTVHSVEHDKDWYSTIKEQLPANAKITFSKSTEEYESVVVKQSKKFNIIIVDGVRRNECLQVALGCLTADGVIILDDSNRNEYEQGRGVVQAEGFKQLDFWGVGPGSIEFKSTTIFYRAGNCLNI